MRRFLRIALVCIIPFALWRDRWIQTIGVEADANAGLNSIEREEAQSDDEPPRLDVSERFSISFPKLPTRSGHVLNRTVHGDFSQWPEMKYLNEAAVLDGSKITISDYRIVAGGSTPQAYLPESGDSFAAPDGELEWHRWGSPAVIIPPKSSLVMVRIDLEPALELQDGCTNPSTKQRTVLRDDDLAIAFPSLGEVSPLRTFIPGRVNFGLYDQPQSGCFGNGWYYFFLATLSPDPSNIWVAYSTYSDLEIQAFWTLTSRP